MAEQTKTLEELRKEASEKEQNVKLIQDTSRTSKPQSSQPFWTSKEALALSYSILIFGLLVLGLMSTLVAKYKININRLLRAFALVLIIVAAVFLIVAGYTEQQIAPVMGLLGTIAGYLLGSRHATEEGATTEKETPSTGTP